MKRISKRLIASGALEVVSTAVPGMKDILVLGQGQVARRDARRRSDHRRRTRGRPRDLVPPLAARAARRGAGRTDQQAGLRRRVAALRSGAVPGDAGDPARGDAGERSHRDRVRDRRPRRRRARPGDREPVLRAAPRRRHRLGRGRARRRGGVRAVRLRTRGQRSRARGRVPRRSGTRCSTNRSRGSASGCRSRRSSCRSCSRPTSAVAQVDALAGALARGIEAL